MQNNNKIHFEISKRKILYIGNLLSKHGFNATTIETLGKSFEDEGYSVVYSSNKKNQLIRLFFLKLRYENLLKNYLRGLKIKRSDWS